MVEIKQQLNTEQKLSSEQIEYNLSLIYDDVIHMTRDYFLVKYDRYWRVYEANRDKLHYIVVVHEYCVLDSGTILLYNNDLYGWNTILIHNKAKDYTILRGYKYKVLYESNHIILMKASRSYSEVLKLIEKDTGYSPIEHAVRSIYESDEYIKAEFMFNGMDLRIDKLAGTYKIYGY